MIVAAVIGATAGAACSRSGRELESSIDAADGHAGGAAGTLARIEPMMPGRRVAARGVALLGLPLAIPTSTQFDITGFLQEASSAGPGAGGTLRVNGQLVTVPANTIVILPANALTWHELFTQAPSPYGPSQTGLAMSDAPAPLTTSEIHVIGNRVVTAAGGDQYIAGLIYLAQQDLNTGAGFINFIDYGTGELRVGGALGDASTGARVRINDPAIGDIGTGRFSKGLSPDPRFTVDQDNPTIMSATGFPMCLPRTTPPGANAAETDPLCPQGNRPLDLSGNFLISISMPDPATLAAGQLPDPRIQAPLEVGDYISFAGTLVTDRADATTGPWPGLGNTYLSAHTIVNNTAIYTAPGTDPAYVMIDVTLAGTGGLNVLGAGEAAVRTRFEGMTTDPSRNIHLYGIDLDPLTGASHDRDWGTIGVDPGPPNGAVKGRWRFRPPCDPFGSVPARPDRTCVMNQEGVFLPPTREVRAVLEGQQGQVPGSASAITAANGIFFGQYHAPILEYVFPENVPGSPIVANNFEALPFLACGGGRSSAGTLVGPLVPWPGAQAPVCAGAPAGPALGAIADQVVASGATVTLHATATGSPPLSFAWTQTGGPTVALSDPSVAAPSFVAPAGPATLTFGVTVTNPSGSASATATVIVNATGAPTVNHIAPRTVDAGTPVTLTATCSEPHGLPCTFVWTQTAGLPSVLTPDPFAGATVRFTVALPAGGAPTTLQFSIIATSAAGVSSLPDLTTVTVNPPADVVAITNVEYRTGKQRLIVSATSSVVSPTVGLILQPYVTATGATFDPAGIGNALTNTGGGVYTITLNGAPEPAVPPATPLTVRSTAKGVSPAHGIDRLRQ